MWLTTSWEHMWPLVLGGNGGGGAGLMSVLRTLGAAFSSHAKYLSSNYIFSKLHFLFNYKIEGFKMVF